MTGAPHFRHVTTTRALCTTYSQWVLGFLRKVRYKSTAHGEQKNVQSSHDIVAALKQCSKTRDLERGRKLHTDAVAANSHTDKYIAAALITMYSRCRSMLLARDVFEGLVRKDVVTWTSLIQGYVENGESLASLELFNSMDCEPTHVTYLAVLKACTCLASERESGREALLEKGMCIHEKIKERAFDSNISVASALVDMYSKCGSMRLAREVFEGMIHKDAVTWNCLIRGYVENSESLVALELFNSMDCEPTYVTYIAVLKACACLARERVSERQIHLENGMAIHRKLKEHAFDLNHVVSNTLVDMYSKCGIMSHAREVFERALHKDVITWTCLIQGYVENGESLVALELLNSMDCEPTHVTYLAALTACARLAMEKGADKQTFLEKGMAIHEQVKARALDSNIAVMNTLVDMYSKCGNMMLAREVFERMARKNAVTWTCLIQRYMENGQSATALNLFARMDCAPSLLTYLAVIKSYTCLASECKSRFLEKGISIHKQVKERGFDSDIVLSNTLIEMYCRLGSMRLAREVFERMVRKNVVTWTCLIQGYVENGESSVALELFTSMDCEPDHVIYIALLKACACLGERERQTSMQKGKAIHDQIKACAFDTNVCISNMLVDMYSKCGDMILARDVFERMIYRDAVTWTCLIQGYVENGESSVALELFPTMDCDPGVCTYLAVLKACASLAEVPVGRSIHGTVCKLGLEEDGMISTVLVHFYGRCGSMATATHVFNSMHSPQVASWNALMAGCSSSSQVFGLVKKIREAGLEMDAITYVCILTACSHVGMVEEGEMWFKSMKKHGINPTLEHYNCMVDMLCRANRFEDAISIVNSMPFEANVVTWMSVLDACKKWKNLRMGKVAFDELVKRGVAGAYVIMGDIYTSLGMWHEWERMDAERKEGSFKQPGVRDVC